MKFLITGGEDSLLKVWDYEFELKGQGSSQIFVGHTNSINSTVILQEKQLIVSAGGTEGLYFWKYYGNLEICENEKVVDFEGLIPVAKKKTDYKILRREVNKNKKKNEENNGKDKENCQENTEKAMNFEVNYN